MPSDANFCKQCLNIFSQPGLRDKIGATHELHTQPIHYTMQAFELAASEGCPLCSMFLEKAKEKSDSSWSKIDPDEPLRIHADAESLVPYAGSPREAGLPAQMVDAREKNLQGKINQLHIFGPYPEDIVTLLVVAEPGYNPDPIFSVSKLTNFQTIQPLYTWIEDSIPRTGNPIKCMRMHEPFSVTAKTTMAFVEYGQYLSSLLEFLT